jgi:hypothetical protein
MLGFCQPWTTEYIDLSDKHSTMDKVHSGYSPPEQGCWPSQAILTEHRVAITSSTNNLIKFEAN